MGVTDTTNTIQQSYQPDMLMLLTEDQGGKLRNICEISEQKGGTATFYRKNKASAGVANSAFNLLKNAPTEAEGNTAGDTNKVEVPIQFACGGGQILMEDIEKTSLDIKGPFMRSVANGVARDEDAKIIKAIDDAVTAGDIVPITLTDTSMGTDANVQTLLNKVKLASMRSSVSHDHDASVYVVGYDAELAALYENTKFLSSDFDKIVHRGGSQVMNAKMIGIQDTDVVLANPKRIYIIPAGTIGFGTFPKSIHAGVSWEEGLLAWVFTAARAMGAGVLENGSIIVLDIPVA